MCDSNNQELCLQSSVILPAVMDTVVLQELAAAVEGAPPLVAAVAPDPLCISLADYLAPPVSALVV
jgi:hypothetical protein